MPGYGVGPERYSTYAPTTTASSQRRPCQWGAWHGGDGGKENGRNFRRRRSSKPPVLPRTAGFLSVSVHAAFGDGGPRWQPLNGADRHALLARCQSESVLAGGNGDGGFQLRPDGCGARPSAGDDGRWRRRSGSVSSATDAKLIIVFGSFILVIFRLFIRPFSIIYIRPFSHIGSRWICNSRPVNSAYFSNVTVCRFYPPALLSFFYVRPFISLILWKIMNCPFKISLILPCPHPSLSRKVSSLSTCAESACNLIQQIISYIPTVSDPPPSPSGEVGGGASPKPHSFFFIPLKSNQTWITSLVPNP